MAASKSAQKQARVAGRRQARNKAVRSQVKTNITKAESLIFSGELDAAKDAVKTAIVSLDKAAEHEVIHGNNAARRKARLVKKLNEAIASAEAVEEPKEETE